MKFRFKGASVEAEGGNIVLDMDLFVEGEPVVASPHAKAVLTVEDLRRLIIDDVDSALTRPLVYMRLSAESVRLLKALRGMAESDDGAVLSRLLEKYRSQS